MTQAPPELVQMNVRLPRSLRDAVDRRRAEKGLSRDLWMTRALGWFLGLGIDPPELPAPATTDQKVQTNVRVPASLREQVDARRAPLRLSRDRYVTLAATHALQQHARASTHTNRVGRTAPPPRYRNT